MTKVLVAGANGSLGSKIVSQLAKNKNIQVIGLVRDLNKAPNMDNVQFVQADICVLDEKLKNAVQGVKTVVSAVQGGPEVTLTGQLNLLRVAEEAGVTKFIPSDFSFNMFALDPNEHLDCTPRVHFASLLEKSRIPQHHHVLNGCFMEALNFLNIYDPKEQTISYYGSEDQSLDFTSMDDTAKYTAALAVDFSAPNGPFHVVGESVSVKQLASILEEVHHQTVTLIRKGSTADLKMLTQQLIKRDPSDVFSYLAYIYQLPMMDGRAKLHPQNARYPHIVPQTWKQFLSSHSGMQ